jgi:aryl-phospho-beta-D-glucosidase BglC (GH1 family)
MKKLTITRSILTILIVLISSSCGENKQNASGSNVTNETYSGFLNVSAGQIVDENNQIIQLKGFNVSGWLLNENWINPGFTVLGGDEHEYQIRNFIDNLYPGQNMGKRFTDEFRSHFITRSDFEYWKRLGANHLRLNVSHLLLEDVEQGFG